VKRWFERYAVVAGALALAALLKLHYSRAAAEDLRWVLSPTAMLSELVLGRSFCFRSGEGYLSRELSILISPACAGVNFMIIALLSLALGFARPLPTWSKRAQALLGWLVLAYAATIWVNTLRIALSVAFGHWTARALGLTFQSVHRLIGIGAYLAGLTALCLTVRHWLASRFPRRSTEHPGALGGCECVPGWRRVVLRGLGCYAAVTLVVPLLRGAGATPEYWLHAVPVSVGVVVSGALLFAARGRTWDDGWHAIRSSEHSGRVAAEPRAG
jgi:exosortase K